MKLIYFLWNITPIFIQNIVKYLYMKGKISYYTCKSLNLTDLINGNIKIGKYSKIHHPAKLIGNISIGDYTYLGSYCSGIFDRGKSLKIGKFCSISSGVSFICGPDHDYEKLTTYPTSLLKINHAKTESIHIGNDVWIGKNAMIIKGVTIGTGAVIGAGAIVTKDIPPYAIAVGNPAKVKKYRFDAKTIQKLLESERWNRDIEKIKKNYNLKFIIRD